MKMNGKYLLDTNIMIALFAKDESVVKNLKAAAEVYLPAVVIGELYYGAFLSIRKEGNSERIEEFRKEAVVLNSDEFTAKFYGEIKAKLKRKGKPIPENDLWIAAIAMQYDLVLVSRDKHFENIDGLKTERW